MPKIVTPTLFIDGNEFLPDAGYSVTIDQAIGTHAAFRVIFPSSVTEGYAGALLDNSIAYVGKKITIGVDQGNLNFVGIITSVDLQKGHGASGTIILSGYSPSILLSNTTQCCSFDEGSSLSQVITDTCKEHNTELLKTALGNGTDIKVPYTVQYNESDFSFIQRLCVRYGIWLYDNGSELCIGRTSSSSVDGVYGHTVQSFNLSTQLQGQNFSVLGHDWVNDTPLEAEASAYTPNATHAYLSTIKQESDAVFAKKGKVNWELDQHEYSGQQGIDNTTKINALGKAANMIIASGSSELVHLKIGDSLSLEGLNFTDDSKKDVYGTYAITKISHRFDHSGHYQNDFEGIPEDTQYPPYSNVFTTPTTQAQRGIVIENADPNGLGRIKVQFNWQKPHGTTTPWVKINTPYAGAEKGFYFIPEIGEEVLVGFEGNNPEKPFVLSAGYNANNTSSFANADNNIKAIKTRSGHLIELNDADGAETITIRDKNENVFQIDTANNSITIVSLDKMTFKSKNMDIQVEEDLSVYVGGTKTEMVAKNNMITTSEDYVINASNIYETASEKIQSEADEIKRQATQDITIHSTSGNINKKANKKINNNSGEVSNLF